MGYGDKKLSKYLTQTFTAHCNAMICQQVTLSGDAEWLKVADAVIEARDCIKVAAFPMLGETIESRHPWRVRTNTHRHDRQERVIDSLNNIASSHQPPF